MSTQSLLMPASLSNGRYKLQGKIGDPAINEIYLGWDQRLRRPIAVKMVRIQKNTLLNRFFQHQEQKTLDKFKDEARIVAQFQNDHIVEIYDSGEEGHGKYDLGYIVMRYYSAGSLEQWFKARGKPLSAREVAELLTQAGDAVQYTHNQGYIHRDIKPTNFLVKGTRRWSALPTLVLADFGHALPVGEDTIQDSRGTSYYMAPERWGKGRVIFATDQYALGIMAYYLLTGHHPFVGTRDEVRKQHIHNHPPALSDYGISPAVEAVVFKALAKKSEDRYPSVTAFAEAFRAACKSEPALVTGQSRNTVLVELADIGTPSTFAPLTSGPGSDTRRLSLSGRLFNIALVALAISLIIASYLLHFFR